MEPPSAPPRRGHGPWQGLLLAASLLTFWNSPTTAQIMVQSNPTHVVVGNNVSLVTHNMPNNLQGFRWFKGDRPDQNQIIASYATSSRSTVPGTLFSRREFLFANGTMQIRNVTLRDNGFFTVQAVTKNFQAQQASDRIFVHLPVKQPSIRASKTIVIENNSVNLVCHSTDSGIIYIWIYNNQRLRYNDRMTVSPNHENITIKSIKKEDGGRYQCEVTNLANSKRSSAIILAVYSKVTKPSIRASKTVVTEKESVVLNCDTKDTQISIKWIFRNSSLLSMERRKLSPNNSSLSIDPVHQDDSGQYQCEVYNPLSASKSDLISLTVNAKTFLGLPLGALIGIVIGLVVLVALVVGLVVLQAER